MRRLCIACIWLAMLTLVLWPPREGGSAEAQIHIPHGNMYRHYMGWTRTTWYLSTGNRTASGVWPYFGGVAAPAWIPFWAHIVVPGLGVFVVFDRGGAVWGNHLDVFLPWPGFRRLRDYYTGVYWY